MPGAARFTTRTCCLLTVACRAPVTPAPRVVRARWRRAVRARAAARWGRALATARAAPKLARRTARALRRSKAARPDLSSWLSGSTVNVLNGFLGHHFEQHLPLAHMPLERAAVPGRHIGRERGPRRPHQGRYRLVPHRNRLQVVGSRARHEQPVAQGEQASGHAVSFAAQSGRWKAAA